MSSASDGSAKNAQSISSASSLDIDDGSGAGAHPAPVIRDDSLDSSDGGLRRRRTQTAPLPKYVKGVGGGGKGKGGCKLFEAKWFGSCTLASNILYSIL